MGSTVIFYAQSGLIAVLVLCAAILPSFAHAFPFGGQASEVHKCYNRTIYIRLGPPVPGVYIWTNGTRSYAFGPPSHAGQWLLGLAGAPHACLYTIVPIDVRSGSSIIMHGSSQ